MSQINNLPSLDEIASTSSDLKTNSNDNSIVVNNDGWANFDNSNLNSKSDFVISTTNDDDWAEFASNTESFVDKQQSKDDDVFGDYGEVQIASKSENSSLSINSFNPEQIDSLISTCFPLESPTDIDNVISFPLPTFTTFNNSIQQLPSFQHSLSLWNVLSNIPNDSLGIKYQWRKSNTERLFHQGLGVQERFRTKTAPIISESSTINSNINTDSDNSSPFMNSCNTEEDIFEVNKTVDNDYYVPSISTKEEQISSSSSSPMTHRNKTSIFPQQSTPIKTINLDPGSTTVLNEDVKPPVNTIPNFSFINPKALLMNQ